jgi:glycosyltransferase involved in cell wall biosynthesis
VAERTRILLLVPRLRAGGAEQVMALIARGLSRDKYDVHLGLVMGNDVGSVPLPEWVTVHVLGARRARKAAIPLLRLVWRIRPRVILSGAAEISFMVLLLRQFFPSRTRVLVRHNGTVSAALEKGNLPRYTRLLYRWLYRRADHVICQTRAMAEDMVREIDIRRDKLVVLPNPVDVEGIRAAMATEEMWSGPGPHLLAVGRLSREKGFDLLIAALAEIRAIFPKADLTIVGDGREEDELKRLCHNLKLNDAVCFAGRVNRPYGYFAGATIFVLSSRYEGMPNALLEAAAAGLPLVATPASGGVVDLLRDREGVWLADEISAPALARALTVALRALQPGQRFGHGFFSHPEMSKSPKQLRDDEPSIADVRK